jgi:hypothetical protein
MPDHSAAEFVAAELFEGRRPGFAFKVGPHGKGYYQVHRQCLLRPCDCLAMDLNLSSMGLKCAALLSFV